MFADGRGSQHEKRDAFIVSMHHFLLLDPPQLRELFNITGSQAAPVVGVSFVGLGFRDAAISYLQPHGMPSSGDWAIARTASLFFEVRMVRRMPPSSQESQNCLCRER